MNATTAPSVSPAVAAASAAAATGEPVKVIETTTTETTTPGFFARLFQKHPFLSTVATLAAAGGAGYVAYNQVRNGADPEKIGETLETAAGFIGKFA